MSWFKRRPRVKEQPKQAPHHTSPFTEKMLEESKKNGPKLKKLKKDK
jgi:hypothetical protein